MDGLATDPTNGELLVASTGSNNVAVYSENGIYVITTIPVGKSPFNVALSPSLDEIFVTNSADNTVSVINALNNTVISTIAVGSNPLGLAVNPITNNLYVANNSSNTVSVLSNRSANVPEVPSGVTAAAGKLSATVSWGPPVTFGSLVTGYAVALYPSNGLAPIISNYPSSVLSATFTNLPIGVTYSYSVTALNGNGSGIPYLSTSQVAPYWVPDAPTNVVATAGIASATITWSAPNSNGTPITDYLITPSAGSPIDTHSSTNTSYTVTGLLNDVSYNFTVTAVNLYGNSPASVPSNDVVPSYSSGKYFPVTPTRIVDTRANSTYTGQGSTLQPSSIFSLTLLNNYGIPANATAVSLNVTVTDTTESGYLTVYPNGISLPNTSNINWSQGETKANLVEAEIGSQGRINFFNKFGSTDLIVDLEGYYMPSSQSTGLYYPLSPSRICDTRVTGNQCPAKTLNTGDYLTLQVTGNAGVPAGAEAVVLNLTATNTTSYGFLGVSPNGHTTTSSLDWQTGGSTVSNRVIATLSSTGSIVITNAFGEADVIVDVTGYYSNSPNASTGASFTGFNPTRIVDTRQLSGYTDQGITLTGGGSLTVQIAGVNNVPNSVTAVVINVTATDTTSWGYLTLSPTGATSTSDVNWTGAGQTISNLDLATLSSTGSIIITNGSTTSVNVVIDYMGYY